MKWNHSLSIIPSRTSLTTILTLNPVTELHSFRVPSVLPKGMISGGWVSRKNCWKLRIWSCKSQQSNKISNPWLQFTNLIMIIKKTWRQTLDRLSDRALYWKRSPLTWESYKSKGRHSILVIVSSFRCIKCLRGRDSTWKNLSIFQIKKLFQRLLKNSRDWLTKKLLRKEKMNSVSKIWKKIPMDREVTISKCSNFNNKYLIWTKNTKAKNHNASG